MLRLIPLTALFFLGAAAAEPDYHTRGWIEHARIMPENILMTAKLDSGAKTTSIHAEIIPLRGTIDPAAPGAAGDDTEDLESEASAMIEGEMIDGQLPDDPPPEEVDAIEDGVMSEFMPETIRFRLTSRKGKQVVMNKKVERWVSIRRRGGGTIVRPVVLLDLCIAGRVVRGEVNLADRSGFNYPLLIGRNMLQQAAISIDSREIFIAKRACPPDAEFPARS